MKPTRLLLLLLLLLLGSTAIASLFITATSMASESVATCGNPKGYSYYHHVGLVPKDRSGFSEDKISGGLTTLQILANGDYDILMVDARKQVISMKHDGGRIMLLRKGSNDATFLVVFPGMVIELYSFYRDESGAARFDILSSKGGDAMPIHKSSVMSGECRNLDLSLVR